MNVTFFSKKKSTAQISTKNFLENINLGDFSSVVYIWIKKTADKSLIQTRERYNDNTRNKMTTDDFSFPFFNQKQKQKRTTKETYIHNSILAFLIPL